MSSDQAGHSSLGLIRMHKSLSRQKVPHQVIKIYFTLIFIFYFFIENKGITAFLPMKSHDIFIKIFNIIYI